MEPLPLHCGQGIVVALFAICSPHFFLTTEPYSGPHKDILKSRSKMPDSRCRIPKSLISEIIVFFRLNSKAGIEGSKSAWRWLLSFKSLNPLRSPRLCEKSVFILSALTHTATLATIFMTCEAAPAASLGAWPSSGHRTATCPAWSLTGVHFSAATVPKQMSLSAS